MNTEVNNHEIAEIERKIDVLKQELYRKNQERYFNKLLIEGWFYGEYEKFKLKTGLVITAEYRGGSSCDYTNYVLSIIEKSALSPEQEVKEISLFLFNAVIARFYNKSGVLANDFSLFISDLILNQRTIK